MTTKLDVLEYFRLHPDSTSEAAAAALGCHPAYFRTTLTRAGMRLKNARPGSKFPDRFPSSGPTVRARERERCAKIAERLGAQMVADAIRATD